MKKLILIVVVIIIAFNGCSEKEKKAKDIKVSKILENNNKELYLEKNRGKSADFREFNKRK